jgi:hypothetical protein
MPNILVRRPKVRVKQVAGFTDEMEVDAKMRHPTFEHRWPQWVAFPLADERQIAAP